MRTHNIFKSLRVYLFLRVESSIQGIYCEKIAVRSGWWTWAMIASPAAACNALRAGRAVLFYCAGDRDVVDNPMNPRAYSSVRIIDNQG